jgi:hypothetical protein
MLTILGGLAEFERELILPRTGNGRTRAKACGVRFGRPPALTAHQRTAADMVEAGARQRDGCAPNSINRRADCTPTRPRQREGKSSRINALANLARCTPCAIWQPQLLHSCIAKRTIFCTMGLGQAPHRARSFLTRTRTKAAARLRHQGEKEGVG